MSAALRKTAYSEFVSYNLIAMMLKGEGTYNYKEAADLVGLKPTHNFKRRINQMVEHKMIETITAFTPRGGLEIRFVLPTPEKEAEQPTW